MKENIPHISNLAAHKYCFFSRFSHFDIVSKGPPLIYIILIGFPGLNMHQHKMGNVGVIFPNFQNRASCVKHLKDKKIEASIWRENMLGYLSLDNYVLLNAQSFLKTVRFWRNRYCMPTNERAKSSSIFASARLV